MLRRCTCRQTSCPVGMPVFKRDRERSTHTHRQFASARFRLLLCYDSLWELLVISVLLLFLSPQPPPIGVWLILFLCNRLRLDDDDEDHDDEGYRCCRRGRGGENQLPTITDNRNAMSSTAAEEMDRNSIATATISKTPPDNLLV